MTKPTPLYSAFGIVSLESIWPSSRGDEVPLNFTDVTLLSERVELSLPDGKGGSFTDYQETLKEKEATAKQNSEELSNELRSFYFPDPVVEKGSRSREDSDPNYSREQQIDLRVLELFNGGEEEWPSGYEFSYFDENGNEIVIDSNEDLQNVSLDPEGKVVSSTEQENDVSDIDSGNEFDERYYNVSPNQKRVLNTLWENMLPDSEGVKVTSVSGSYPEGGTHYGFDVVGLPQQNSGGQEPLVAYPLDTEGEVVLAGVRGSSNSADAYGNSVVVKINDSDFMIAFSHLSEVFVSVGDNVSKGTPLGRQGNTGRSSGDHVDVEVRKFYGVSEDGTKVSAGGPPNTSQFSSYVEPHVGEISGSNSSALEDIDFNSSGDDDSAFKTEVIQNLYDSLKKGELGYDESNIVPGIVEVKTISFSTERVSFSDDSSPREVEQKINSLKNNLESLKGKLESGEYSKESLEQNYSLGDITILSQTPTEVSGSGTSLNSLHDIYLNRVVNSILNYLNSEVISSKLEGLSKANDDLEDFSQNIINSQEYAMYPKAHVRPGFSSSLTSEEAYKKRRGYFKIIPLNVLQISTNTSTGGTIGQSSFNVSFTLDDVIIVADEYGEKGIFDSLSSTALPISIDGVFDELYKIYGGEIPDTLKKEIVPYGFSAYRISGNNFTFNLEDVLEANDTATIWLYHDPKEFDFITTNTLIQTGEGSESDDNGEDSQNGEENDVNPSPYENDTDVQELIELWKREEVKISDSVSSSISGVNIDFDSYDEYVKILRTSSPEERQAIIDHYQDQVNNENSSPLPIPGFVKNESRALLDVAVNIDNEVSPESSNPQDDSISTNPDSSESIEASGPVKTYRVKDNKVSVRVAGKSIETNGEYQGTIIEASLYRNPTKISFPDEEEFDSLISEKSNDARSIYAVDDSGEFLVSDDEFNEFSGLKKRLDAFYILEFDPLRGGAGDPRLRKAVRDVGSIRNISTWSPRYNSPFETPADDYLDSFSEEIKVYNRYVDLKTKVESDEYTEEEKDAFVKDFEDFLTGVFVSSSNETQKEKNNLRNVISEEVREVENTFVKEYPPPYTEEEEPVSNTPDGNENDVSDPGFGGGGGEEDRNDNFYTENYFDYVNNFIENKDFSYVIGTGARKSSDDYKLLPEDERSFFNVPKTEIQSILIDAEVLSPYVSQDKLEKIRSGEEVVNLSSSETLDILIAMGRRSNLSGFNNRDLSRSPTSKQNQNYLEYLSENIFGGSSVGGRGNDEINKKRFKGFMNDLFLADYDRFNERFSDSSVGAGESDPLVQVNPQLYRDTFLTTSGALRSLLNSSVYDDYIQSGDPDDLETLINNFKLSTTEQGLSLGELYTDDEVAELFNFVNNFSKDAERLVEGALEFFADQNETEEIVPSFDKRGFYNKRKLLVSKSHGETPYLVLKGHISTVESKYGASQGSHVVTISGGGYEKILNENIVYFEDLFFPGGETRNKIVDANTIYSNMLPPEALLSFVETHVPRYIVIGKKSKTIKDTQNYSLQFFTSSIDKKATELDYDPEEGGYVERPIPEPLDVTENENFFLKEDDILVRGKAVFNFSQTRNSSEEEENVATGEVTDEPSRNPMVRVFYPINYLNTSRIQEMINATNNVFEDEEEVQIRIPIKITSKQSVASNMLNFNGPKEINHMFVDETGRLRQRLAFEAWERTPNPAYTPIITDDDVLASGASFANNSDSISTMVDVTPNYLTSGSGIVSALFSGRTLASGNDYIPIISSSNIEYLNLDDTLYSNFYESMSEEFFRYGMRYKKINDIYTTSTAYAERKSILYQSFFSKPIKTAKIPVKGNSSYRAGETVLVYLDNYRYRSQEMIDVEKTYDWLQYLKTSPDKDRLLPIYIGVDERWLNHDSYYLTSQLNELPEYSSWLGDFKNNPHEFVLNQFIDTFQYLRNKLKSNNNLIYVTPDYFPMTWWAFNRDPSLSLRFNSRVRSGPVPNALTAYDIIYNVLLGLLGSSVKIPEVLRTSGEIMNAIRMQNFRVASYYIDAVQHDFVHGENFTTNLTLNHGQDNLAIVEPFGMKPIGFMSIEKRMKIGYDDAVVDENGSLVFPSNPNRNTSQRALWLDFDSKEKSEIQKFYIDQFHQDKTFKETSFLFRSQLNRNSSNFMYELGLDLGLDN